MVTSQDYKSPHLALNILKPVCGETELRGNDYLGRGRRDDLGFGLLLDLDARNWSRVEGIQEACALHG